MPDEKTRLRLQIAHVLFIDIVGYSKLLIDQQSEYFVSRMALVFRDNAEAPAHCALRIAQELKSHPQTQLRIGIHSGPFNESLM